MKILVVGNGGREHAIAYRLQKSNRAKHIQVAGSGINFGIDSLGIKQIQTDLKNPNQILEAARNQGSDLVIFGPEDPIALGGSDLLTSQGIPVFAPSKNHAQLESSKSFTRDLIQKNGIKASPKYYVSTEVNDVNRQNFYNELNGQIVVKADGLLGGKGVLVADDHFKDFETADAFARKSIEVFGRVVLEQKMIGPEFSLISMVDGKTVLDTPIIRDHKRAFNGDMGPNTGGMGTISDVDHLLAGITPEDKAAAHEITVQVMQALAKKLGSPYKGVMYGGFMKTHDGVRLIEYNIRFGDPECLNIMALMESDLVDLCEATIYGKLDSFGDIKFKNQASVVKYLCAEGYPDNPIKGGEIEIPDDLLKEQLMFFGAQKNNLGIITKGSREIGLVCLDQSIQAAADKANHLAEQIKGPLFYRSDIGL